METQHQHRPNLQPPVWTDREDRLSLQYPASHRSDGLPSAMYPSSAYDRSMRHHERAMLDSLDQRGRQFEARRPSVVARSLSPLVEGPDSRRASIISFPPPRAPASSPQSPSRLLQHPRRQTLAAETRSILLSGIPESPPRVTITLEERRASLPFQTQAPRRNSQAARHELQAWGHVFLLNGSEAHCFVSAVALRRPSEGPSSGEEKPQTNAGKENSLAHKSQLTVRVRVRPCALNQKPFLLTRTFDMDLLRATIPEPEPVYEGPRRLSADLSSRRGSLSTSHRRSSVASRERSPRLDGTPLRSTNTVPIHRPYACAFFPVLAALLYSKHIQPRDIIDLPMPHPEVWGQTVAHVYTGQGELTEAIKQNILYLGGKV
ncbi:hypothetical protein QBC38DRAFT_451604 [Podospora fimiseda]|uniref:Uncharacterized protein n=1 Tax=Podospora fimiseda TaxID=252190 RepID=A0AAN7BX60_9PEZI|nr:hypothetical protein QBC38DRAFT_451604 [Podospora fimiseda]